MMEKFQQFHINLFDFRLKKDEKKYYGVIYVDLARLMRHFKL